MQPTKTINVINQNGEKVTLDLIDTIKMNGTEYVIVGPKESHEAYAYKSVLKNGETEYLSIGQGEEFKKVLEEYNKGQ